mgnify:CR=1 FL=1
MKTPLTVDMEKLVSYDNDTSIYTCLICGGDSTAIDPEINHTLDCIVGMYEASAVEVVLAYWEPECRPGNLCHFLAKCLPDYEKAMEWAKDQIRMMANREDLYLNPFLYTLRRVVYLEKLDHEAWAAVVQEVTNAAPVKRISARRGLMNKLHDIEDFMDSDQVAETMRRINEKYPE